MPEICLMIPCYVKSAKIRPTDQDLLWVSFQSDSMRLEGADIFNVVISNEGSYNIVDDSYLKIFGRLSWQLD